MPRRDVPAAPGRSAARVEARREEILEVAAQLFASRGYPATTLDDIAERMGFTKPAIYYYFSSKEEMLVEIFEQIMERYASGARTIAESPDAPAIRFRRLFENHIDQVVTHTTWTTIFFKEAASLPEATLRKINAAKRDYDRLFERVYVEGVEAGTLKPGEPHTVVSGVIGMANSLYTWYSPSGPVSPDRVKELYWEIIAKGCLTRRLQATPASRKRPEGR